jgi:hypothetical protein
VDFLSIVLVITHLFNYIFIVQKIHIVFLSYPEIITKKSFFRLYSYVKHKSSVVTGQCPGQVTQKRNDNPSKFYYDN